MRKRILILQIYVEGSGLFKVKIIALLRVLKFLIIYQKIGSDLAHHHHLNKNLLKLFYNLFELLIFVVNETIHLSINK